MTATETCRKLKINRNTVNKYYRIIRGAVANYQEVQYQIQTFSSSSQVHYFSWSKNKGLTPNIQEGSQTFLLATNKDKVFVDTVDADTLEEIKEQLEAKEVTNENENADKELSPLSFEHFHHRAGKKLDISIRFFNYAKDKLTKFYGVKSEYTYLYLKELEFRFNNQGKDLSKLIWKILPHHSAEWVKTNRYRR